MSPMAPRTLLPTATSLLEPEYLGRVEGRRIDGILRQPLSSVDGLSEVPLERILTSGHGGTRAFVLKRFSYASDWIMRASADSEGGRSRSGRPGCSTICPRASSTASSRVLVTALGGRC